MRSTATTTIFTSLLLLHLIHAHTIPHSSRDAVSANIPAGGINITTLAEDPDRLHDAFTSYSTRRSITKRAYADTANELTDGTSCREITLIYARGTTQDGNIGAAGDVGPLFMNNLSTIVGADALAVQGVDYAANVIGFLEGGDPEGSKTMADLVAQVSLFFFCFFLGSSFHYDFRLYMSVNISAASLALRFVGIWDLGI